MLELKGEAEEKGFALSLSPLSPPYSTFLPLSFKKTQPNLRGEEEEEEEGVWSVGLDTAPVSPG